MLSDLVYPFAIVLKQCAEESAAEPDHARYYRIEYRLHIGWRARDDSQDFTGCSLLLERLDAGRLRSALIAELKIAAPRLQAAGFGATRPRETNGTLEGRARNRRVELVRSCSSK